MVDSLVTKFHNLEGTTIGQKKRSLFQLLQQVKTSSLQNETLLDTIIPQLMPKSHLEHLFLVDLLIYFRRFKELCTEFLKGDEIVINKISKQKWFFGQLFQGNGNEFVNLLLPSLSYRLRVKILRKLALVLNEQQCDEIFDALLARYGSFFASNILTGCSCAKIEQILRNYPFNLWTAQLKILYKKKPQLIDIYLEELVKHHGDTKYLNYTLIPFFVGTKDPEMYCNILEKYNIECGKVGKRATKRIVRTKKENIIARPELYAKNLNLPRLVRNLGKDFQQVYHKLFLQNTGHSFSRWNDAHRLLSCFSKKHQFTFFRDIYNKVFDEPLETACVSLNNYDFTYILDMISDGEEREKWIRLKQEHDKNDNFTKYLRASNCIATLKPKLTMFSQVSKRAECIGTMTESCLINRDMKSLLKVCKLLCGRLKNDSRALHMKFLESLPQRNINQDFDAKHWKYIKEIIIIAEDSSFAPIAFMYLEFACRHGNIKETEMLNLLKKVSWISHLDHFKSQAEIERTILLSLIKLAPQIISGDDTIEKADVHLIVACREFAVRHGEKIDIFKHERLIQSIISVLNNPENVDYGKIAAAAEWIAITGFGNAKVDELLMLLWENTKNFVTVPLMDWFLKHRPDLVVANMENFLNIIIEGKFGGKYYWEKQARYLWKIVKCYSHLQIDQKVIEFCVSKLGEDDYQSTYNLAEPLSQLMPAKDFIELVENHKPEIFTVDFQNTEANQKFQLQRRLLKSFVNLNSPEEIVAVLLQFMGGDYVASCVSPLHSSLYKMPGNNLAPILDKICNIGAVSAKKHGFYFVCITQDASTILRTLKSCHLSQSIAMAYQHFVKNPSDLSWQLFKTKLPKLDNNDHWTSIVLVNTPAPKCYKAHYFETAYEIFRAKGNRFTNVLVDKLLEETIGELSPPFFTTIKDDFLKMKKSEMIFSYYILHCPENYKFDVVCDALRNFKQRQWSLLSSDPRERLNGFISTFYRLYMEQDKIDLSLVTIFAQRFEEIFPAAEAFQECVMFAVMRFKGQDKLTLSKSVIDLHNTLVSTYGKLVFAVLADCLNEVFQKFYPDEISKFEFYSLLLDCKKGLDNALLVMKLLPQERPKLKASANFYQNTKEALKQSESKVLHLHWRRHFEQ